MNAELKRDQIVAEVQSNAPQIWQSISAIAENWLAPVCERLTSGDIPRTPKIINDSIWGTIEILPWEVILLDSMLLQRLRGVRQLGLAHYVFPGATHNRLEHTLGVLEAADRMIRWLERNAEHRRHFSRNGVPVVGSRDRYAVRLAALLHDIGHGPFSHAFEPFLVEHYEEEIDFLRQFLTETFVGADSISPSEILSVVLCLTNQMLDVFRHDCFPLPEPDSSELLLRIVSRILGSRLHLDAPYLSSIISGPLDSDKLDYMARDSYHAGLPVGLDTSRLISKLEVVIITPDNLPKSLPDVRERARRADDGQLYEVGIALSGVSAYEQLIVSRVMLYDKLYYHHKVRAADAMARRLIAVSQQERGQALRLEELFRAPSDDALLASLGDQVPANTENKASSRAHALAVALQERRLYHRAFAFASRFISGLEGLEHKNKAALRAEKWRKITKNLSDLDGLKELEKEIYETAKKVASAIPDFKHVGATLQEEHVLVDFPSNRVAVRGNRIFTRTEGNKVEVPNLFFDSEKWSEAYEHQKRSGYVFSPRKYLSLIQISAKVTFYKKWRLVMSENADEFSKTENHLTAERIKQLSDNGILSEATARHLLAPKEIFRQFLPDDFIIPDSWISERPDFAEYLAQMLNECTEKPLHADEKRKLCKAISQTIELISHLTNTARFNRDATLKESEFQACIRDCLAMATLRVSEGSAQGSGITDLIIEDSVVIENKVHRNATDDPFHVQMNAPFQGRRYAIAICQRAFITLLAYRPKTELGILRCTDSVRVSKVGEIPDGSIEVRFVVPYGQGVPSKATMSKAPNRTPDDP